jgi:ubiquinone/menaquinone biosynthesis C-methylase UbiE
MSFANPESIRRLSDQEWLALLIKSTETPMVDGFRFPSFPSQELQTKFVGSADEQSLREASVFYQLVKQSSEKYDAPLTRTSRVLDFGCGWGRYLRFFMKDVDEANLYGCDTNDKILDVCRETGVPGTLSRIEPLGNLPYPDDHFDMIMAYSVFTHLPERVHLHWLRELARVARRGSMFCLTLEPRRFIDYIEDIAADTTSDWARMLAKFKPRVDDFRRQFDAGELVFMPTNEGIEHMYGDAVVPLSFVERAWSPLFEIKEYIDDPNHFWQAALVVRRAGGTRR